MKSILLIGLGRFGRTLAEKLNELDHQVMAIDQHEERVNDILPIVTDAQIGDATNADFLKTLGVSDYDVCFVAISDDFQSSLETTSLLKELGAKKVISRASSEVQRKFLLRNGADEVVYPEGQLAAWAAIRHTSDHVLDYIDLEGEYDIYELTVPEEWDGKTVAELDIRKRYNVNLLVVRDAGTPFTAVSGETLMRQNQAILALGKWKDVQKCFRL